MCIESTRLFNLILFILCNHAKSKNDYKIFNLQALRPVHFHLRGKIDIHVVWINGSVDGFAESSIADGLSVTAQVIPL